MISEHARVETAQALQVRGSKGISELLAMLSDPSWLVRRAVVSALAAIGDAAVEPLCELLRTARDNEARIAAIVDALSVSRGAVEAALTRLAEESNPAIVADVAQILGRRRNPSAVPALIRLTKHADDNVAVAAVEGLGRIGGRAAVEALIAAVESGNFFRTFPAIDVLGRSGDPRVVEPLAKLLSNPSYLPEAARSLGRSGERAAVKPLVELLIAPSDAVVRVAALSLWDLRQRFDEKSGGNAVAIDELLRTSISAEALRRLLRTFSSAEGSEAIAVCRFIGILGRAEAAPLLVTRLSAGAALAACAADALKRIGKEAEDHLAQALREGESARRKVLLPVISRSAAADDVAQCLNDSDSEVRALACDALARLGNPKVVPQVFPLLADANLRVVHAATAAIQTLGSRATLSHAVVAASSDNSVVRRAALNILAYFGDLAATQPLLDGLRDPDARVREAAIQGLPYLEDPRALDALFDATRSQDARMRALAMRALGTVPKASERGISLLLRGLSDADAWVRYYACQSIGRLAYAPATREIARLLEDPAGQVRVSAVEALSHLGTSDAQTVLRQAAASDDPDVKRAALVGLGIAHRLEDLPFVLSAAGSADASTRLVALSALVSFPSPQVLGALSAAGADTDEQVRWAAIGFLSARPEQEATELLVGMLVSEETREQAKASLQVPNAGRISGLLVALEAANDELAGLIVSILGRIERPEARAALLAAVRLTNSAARKAAATGLATRMDPEVAIALREAAENDPDPEVRKICALLLCE